ncbi:MAG: anti-sigma factor family protein [Pyrinomonadaceae bacterium]
MKCSDIQHELPLYADGTLAEQNAAAVAAHLDTCPVCRVANAEFVGIRSAARRMSRPGVPAYLNVRVKTAATAERRAMHSSWLPFPADVREWLMHAVMPYSVGAVASLVLGVGLLVTLSTSVGRYSQPSGPGPAASGVMLAQDRDPWAKPTVEGVSPVAFAKTRSDVAGESPSMNPNGALVALTRSFVRGDMKDDEVVVVADVFSDGLAQIQQVVEPSRDSHAVEELQKAFDSDPNFAPFVPAKLENRPDSVRVVLRFQRVDVKTGLGKSGRVRL